jgi:serine/threonine protein kinase
VSEAPDPYVGSEISGHIEIRQLAGIGAMGRVYRAFQKGIERDVAVKILHRELSANPQLVARFHREAKVASRLSHPNVVQVHLAGQLPDGALFIVMEYLDGLSLQSALAAAGGHMPLPRALHIALQICDAAGEAHSQGVVHRDLKPENVMLVRRGDDVDYVKVLDFGIARLNWGDQSMATAAGLIFGTARYISPEGAQGEAVGPQGDVYAIATLLYQMLGGRTPFEGDQAVALLVQQIHDPAPSLKGLARATDVPDPIASVVMRNLAKRAADRMTDARTLGRSLVEAAKASGLSPEELVPRSVLLGSKPGPLQLPPMQRTKQLELSTELAARLAGVMPVSSASGLSGLPVREEGGKSGGTTQMPARIAATSGAPAPASPPGPFGRMPSGPPGGRVPSGTTKMDVMDAPRIPPGVGAAAMTATAPMAATPNLVPSASPPVPRPDPTPGATIKWPSPPEFAARLAPDRPDAGAISAAPPGGNAGAPPGANWVPRKRVDSNVEDTMDDDDAAAPGVAPAGSFSVTAPRNRTEFGEPLLVPGPLAPPTPGPPAQAAAAPLGPLGLGLTPPFPPARVPASPSSAGKLVSTVESTLSEEDGATSPVARIEESGAFPETPRRAKSRLAVFIVFCFLFGALVAAGVLVKWGVLGQPAQISTLDSRVNRANEAMRRKQWDGPPGDNVREITDEGLKSWPGDKRLLDVRERAADELVKEAVDRKFEGDLAEALHLARLANQLDPRDVTAQHLVQEYEAESAPKFLEVAPAAVDASVAPLHSAGARPSAVPSQPASTARVILDTLPARPRIGQPVAFSAKVTTSGGAVPKAIEDVHFKLNGPGLSTDTRLTPVPDVPGTYRAAFTFFEAGRYELTFEARVDGVLIRTQKQVTAGDEGAGSSPPLPPPVPSGKWL